MSDPFSCFVAVNETAYREDPERSQLLRQWLEPFALCRELDLSGLSGILFTPKLFLSQYGGEFIRRKNGDSYILISEALWQNSRQDRQADRLLQNTVQHELAHVDNNNRLKAIRGSISGELDAVTADYTAFFYRAWDEYYATRLAAESEPLPLLQAKTTGLLAEQRLLTRAMTSFSADRARQRKEHLEATFLACIYLCGSLALDSCSEREKMLQPLQDTPFAAQICQISAACSQVYAQYPFSHYAALHPLLQSFTEFVPVMIKACRPRWQRLLVTDGPPKFTVLS
ncbi:MAG: hypothetical protein LLG09_05540 [Negativicutes bacterium]|nr:hypothetical protein [Negativicutes bacterium]